MIDNCGLVKGPTRIGKPDLLALGIGKRLRVGDGAGLGVKIRDVQGSAGNLPLESSLVLKANFGLINRETQSIKVSSFCQVALNLLKSRLPLGVGVIR